MNFCDVCDNMLYLKIAPREKGDAVLNFCRNCGSEKEVPITECLSKRVLKKPDAEIVLHKYTKYDPTLPRINKQCPACPAKEDIIYVRYDESGLKYVYMCPQCDHTWKN